MGITSVLCILELGRWGPTSHPIFFFGWKGMIMPWVNVFNDHYSVFVVVLLRVGFSSTFFKLEKTKNLLGSLGSIQAQVMTQVHHYPGTWSMVDFLPQT